MTKTKNPLVDSKEYQEALQSYKTGLLTYQPGPNWYFGGYESGIDFEGNFITLEKMQEMARIANPVGPSVDVSEVVNVTPTYEEYVELTKNGYGDYVKWIREQKDVFHYSRCREDFSRYEAFQIAAKLGYKKVMLEDLS